MATVTLTGPQVRAAVSMPDAIDAVRAALLDLDGGLFEQPTRTVLGAGRFLVMAAHHRPTGSTIVKSLSLNFDRAPAVVGAVTWTDTRHTDQLVADAASITALRTGAIVGVATDLLAPAEARRMVLIGAGGQAADQVRAVHAVRPLRTLTVVNRDLDKAKHLIAALNAELGGISETTAVGSGPAAEEALADAEIVCCATSTATPLFTADMLPERVHVNAIGAYRPDMRELPSELLADATVLVDQREAALEESGEILHAIAAGLVGESDLVELGAALRTGVPQPRRRTVFKAVGIAVQDWAIARLLAAKTLPGWEEAR
ncbi:ornithine cyclodeaminase family protein [Catenulispora subtropica]|uniref:Ornithine cyclodeaminase family protein n=1 Tax=Catenulispora subtropica TaxID=450798 RepID=A0ABP5DQF0_9ACTN